MIAAWSEFPLLQGEHRFSSTDLHHLGRSRNLSVLILSNHLKERIVSIISFFIGYPQMD